MMRMMEPPELVYLENTEGNVQHRNASYNFVRSILFGFSGWDRYILTEDMTLKMFLEYIIAKHIPLSFFSFKIIHIGGGSNTVDLMTRNIDERFFPETEKVISILDGDQKNERHTRNVNDIFFIPFPSVEKELYIEYNDGMLSKLPDSWKGDVSKPDGKGLFHALKISKLYTPFQLFEHICAKHQTEMKSLIENLRQFLN
jgi:hypothetical protein